jgi:hypothetical protein
MRVGDKIILTREAVFQSTRHYHSDTDGRAARNASTAREHASHTCAGSRERAAVSALASTTSPPCAQGGRAAARRARVTQGSQRQFEPPYWWESLEGTRSERLATVERLWNAGTTNLLDYKDTERALEPEREPDVELA